MTAPRFTPGPWYADGLDGGHAGIWSEATGQLIAETHRGEREDGALVSDDEIDANAHLLASAPALYAALEKCEWAGVREGEDACPICFVYEDEDHMSSCALAAALAAARGGA